MIVTLLNCSCLTHVTSPPFGYRLGSHNEHSPILVVVLDLKMIITPFDRHLWSHNGRNPLFGCRFR